MYIIQIAIIAIIAAILSVILKQYKPEYSVLVQIGAGIIIILLLVSTIIHITDNVDSLISSAGLNKNYTVILLKALGICIITQFASDTCKDAGETALSSKVEMAGKITVLALSLPLIKSVLELAVGLING